MGIKSIITKFLNAHNKKSIIKKAVCCGENLKVNGKTIINSKTYLGNNVNFNGLTIIGNGEVHIGDNFHSGQDCFIITQNHNYDTGNSIPYDSSVSLEKEIIIEDNVWIGIGVIILAGAHIGEGAIIQAGSVVIGNIEPFSIAGGHPAKKFKTRDIDHYMKLKMEGKFF